MASFDINSLFTNVPLDETIDIIVKKAFNNSALHSGFSVTQLRKLLCLSVKNFFSYLITVFTNRSMEWPWVLP